MTRVVWWLRRVLRGSELVQWEQGRAFFHALERTVQR